MTSFLKIIGLIFLCAALFVGASNYFDFKALSQGGEKEIAKKLKDLPYTVAALEGDIPTMAPPELPDISGFTAQNVAEKIPPYREGYVLIEGLEKGFSKLRGQVDFFGDKQGRLDPLSIVLADGVYTLEMLMNKVADPSLLEREEESGTYILHVPLSIRTEGTLVIKPGETLLLDENTGGLISTFGDLFIMGATVKGWDVEGEKPAEYTSPERFRPYLVAWCGANMHMANSTIAHLGFSKSKSYGITYTSCSDTLYRDDFAGTPGGTGHIIGNKFIDIYFGFYSYEADDVVILKNEYVDNVVYAIDPHDRSKNLIIAHNHTHGAKKKHGIIISRDVNHSFIFNNVTENNEGSGIMIDRNSHDNVIAYNIARNNKGDGLTFYESSDNISYKNQLVNNGKAGLRIRNSWNVTSYEDMINNNGQLGLKLYTAYLDNTNQDRGRDLELDPYVQRAELKMIKPEIVGNRVSDFKVDEFNKFELYDPRLFKSPSTLFSGDLGKLPQDQLRDILAKNIGLVVQHKDPQSPVRSLLNEERGEEQEEDFSDEEDDTEEDDLSE